MAVQVCKYFFGPIIASTVSLIHTIATQQRSSCGKLLSPPTYHHQLYKICYWTH